MCYNPGDMTKNTFFFRWLAVAAVITVIFGTIYAAVQQEIRQGANDLQVQLGEDMAVLLATGVAPQALLQTAIPVDFKASLSPFAMIFDKSGKLIASSGTVGTTTPLPPAGVFDYARTHADDRLTWQPEPGVRVAAFVKYFNASSTGYVLLGKNLRETEKKESQTATLAFIGWIVSIVISGGLGWMMSRKAQ